MKHFILAAAAAVISAAGSAHADVFNMPAGQTSLQFVTVGDPGNAADTGDDDGTTGYGSVPYTYQMGKYDVTVGQYCQFLNAVAKTDTYGLYNSYMATAPMPTIGITQSGSSGSYSYSVTGSYSQGRQLSDLRCHVGRCGPLLQLAAKRPADRRPRERARRRPGRTRSTAQSRTPP